MRILHILDHSLPLHSGYSFRTRAIVKAQMARGWEVACLTGSRHFMPGPDPETCEGITFHRTPPVAPAKSPLREWREIRALAARLERFIAEWRPDQLHVHSPVLNALAALRIAKKSGLPLLYEIRAFWEDAAVGNGTGRAGSVKYRLTRALEDRAVSEADAVFTICHGLRDDLIARGHPAGKIGLSPNGVDFALFGDPPPRDDALAAQLALGSGPVIGFIGSFYDYEGLDDLIAAMPSLRRRHPDAALLLVGGGPVDAALRRQAEGIAGIHFTGRVPHGEVDRYYSLIDVLAYPRKASRLTELVTPLKPLEAMAQGRIVAASDVGGHRELIADGVTGALFPPDDPATIGAALADLIDGRAEWPAMRERARLHVAARHDWANNIRRYQDVYHHLLGRNPNRELSAAA